MDGKSVRSLKAIDLYEASIVNVPCNPSASVTGAKSLIDVHQATELIAEIKAGRVLSASNLASMRRWVEQARQYAQLADEMQAMIDTHDAPKLTDPPAIPPALTGGKSFAVEMDLYREFLATVAKHA